MESHFQFGGVLIYITVIIQKENPALGESCIRKKGRREGEYKCSLMIIGILNI